MVKALTSSHACSLSRLILLAIISLALLSPRASAQGVVVYAQNFDNPVGSNGDVYFQTSSLYNGLNDGSSSGGITTGASFAGNSLSGINSTLNGIIATSFPSIFTITPHSGPYLLEDGTDPDANVNYAANVFSVSVKLLPASTYRFSFYAASAGPANEPQLQVLLNGAALGATFTPNLGSLLQYTFAFDSGSAPTALLAINDLVSDGAGNDAAFDDIQVSLVQTTLPLSGLNPNEQAIASKLSSGALNAVSTPVVSAYLANPAALGNILDQLSPLQFGQFTSTTAFNNATFDIEGRDNYLSGRRGGNHDTFLGGNGQIDSSGLTLNDPSYDPALSMVHSRLLAWNPAPLNGAISDVASALPGGFDMRDSKEMKSAAGPVTDPWNVYVRGSVILAQGFSQPSISHFDDNTESVEIGVDYTITPNFLIGVDAGYGHTDVTLDDNGSSATVDSYSPGLYASYADGGWYANAMGNYVHNAYTQARSISFLSQTANSAPEGNEGVADLDGGYDFHAGALTYGPLAGLQYTHLTVDGYSESGSVADLSVNDDQSDSLRSRLGGRLSYALSHCGMNFTPHLDASWQHEFMDQSRGITSSFNGTALGSFSVRTENPSRESALVDAGLDAEINQTVTLFTDYVVQAGQANYFGQSVQFGAKIKF